MSDCTEIFGRKNDLGSSPEMILRQKVEIRPESYGGNRDQPFQPGSWKTGVLARGDNPEYLDAWRRHTSETEGD